MAGAEGRVRVAVRHDAPARQQLRRHGADDRAARRVALADDLVHHRHGDVRESRSQPGCLLTSTPGQSSTFGEQQHDGARLLVDFVVLLALDVLVPGGVILREDGGAERRHVDLAEVADRDADIHARQNS